MGDHIRAILAGEIESAHIAALQKEIEGLKHHIPPRHETTLGIFREFMDLNATAELVVVDGHPRDADRAALREVGAIAVCRFDISNAEAIARSQAREQRFEDAPEDEVSVLARLERYRADTLPVLERLAAEFPSYVLDGNLPIQDGVSSLRDIYHATSALAPNTGDSDV
jgi:adenylate kinase family enzyme